jgi:transcriptional regulator with XRE-family HTH domain
MDLKRLGEQIKKARNEKNISQLELAEKLGVRRATISRYEGGSLQIPLTQLQKLADVLGKNFAYFFEFDEPKEPIEALEHANKYIDDMRKKVDKQIKSMTIKRLLAFSLKDSTKKSEALDQAKGLMQTWYQAQNMEKKLKKSFEQWWEGEE